MDIGLIVGVAGFVVTAVGGIVAWAIKINKGENAAELAKDAMAKAEKAEADLADFKVKVASEYATAGMVAAIESRVVAAIDRLGDRLDRVFERGPATTTRTARSPKG